MSFEHEWPLTVWPARGEVEAAIAATVTAAKLEAPEIYHEAFGEISVYPPLGLPAANAADRLATDTIVTLLFRVPVAGAIDAALRLDPLATRDSYTRKLAPPRGTPTPDHYTLAIDLVAPEDGKPSRVRIYSNEYDNREAYAILAVIAADLADRLEKLSAFS